MTTELDYPAAHSMDTVWWAVDGQGHVARISTGEAGSVPAEMPEPPDAEELPGQLAAAGIPYYCDDLFTQADGKLYVRDYREAWDEVAQQSQEVVGDVDYYSGFLLWLRDEAALARLKTDESVPARPTVLQRVRHLFAPAAAPVASDNGWPVLRLPVADKVVVWISTWGDGPAPTLARLRELVAVGDVLRGWVYKHELELERFGLFAYGLGTFDNWIAGPVERGADPPRPLRLHDLPPAARESLSLCPLPDLDFRRERLLQPFEYGPAYCWGEHWISTTGRQFRNEQYGPELVEVAADGSTAVASGGSSLPALAAAYLNGEPGAAEVLNDFLEEAGHPRIAANEARGNRLDELLVVLLTPDQLQQAAAAFVEHALQTNPPPDEAAAAARAAIDTYREWLGGKATAEQLKTVAAAALQSWMPSDENIDDEGAPLRDNGVAWSAWALTRRWPLVAARTARTIQPGEWKWQAEYVLQRLAGP
jgi:hypothetical protein